MQRVVPSKRTTYKTASWFQCGSVIKFFAFCSSSKLGRLLLLLCRLFMGMAIGRPASKSDFSCSFFCRSIDASSSSCALFEMTSFDSNTQTTYGSKPGRSPLASRMVTKSLPLSEPTEPDWGDDDREEVPDGNASLSFPVISSVAFVISSVCCGSTGSDVCGVEVTGFLSGWDPSLDMARGVRGGVFFGGEESFNVSLTRFSEDMETRGNGLSWSGGGASGEHKEGRHGLEK